MQRFSIISILRSDCRELGTSEWDLYLAHFKFPHVGSRYYREELSEEGIEQGEEGKCHYVNGYLYSRRGVAPPGKRHVLVGKRRHDDQEPFDEHGDVDQKRDYQQHGDGAAHASEAEERVRQKGVADQHHDELEAIPVRHEA